MYKLVNILPILLGMALLGCEDKATVQQLLEVEATVQSNEKSVKRLHDATVKNQKNTNRTLQTLQYRQKQTEAAFAQMGRGFNHLVEAVQDVHEVAIDADQRTRKIAKNLKDAPTRSQLPLTQLPARQLLGEAESMTGEITNASWLWIDNQALYKIVDGQRITYELQQYERRIYGRNDTGIVCLDILEITPMSVFASPCNNHLWTINFRPVDAP